MGAVNCTKAVWDMMRAQNYGRIVMTTSSSGLYGNFGQANYGAAKMALVGSDANPGAGGRAYDIRVNCLAPTAATRMPKASCRPTMLDLLQAANSSARRCWPWCATMRRPAPSCAPARGGFEAAHITLTQGNSCGAGAESAPEEVVARWAEIADATAPSFPTDGCEQGRVELRKAGYTRRRGDAMTMREAVIVSTARTPIGRAYRGAFNAHPGADAGGPRDARRGRARRRRSGRDRGLHPGLRAAAGRRSTRSAAPRRCAPACRSRCRA